MNRQDPSQAGRGYSPDGETAGGSVRRARERAQAGLPPERYGAPRPSDTPSWPLPGPSQQRSQPRGELASNFTFPALPPPSASASPAKRSKDPIAPSSALSSRRPGPGYQMHPYQPSPITEESSSPRSAYSHVSTPQRVKNDSRGELLNIVEHYDKASVYSASRASSPDKEPTIVRQASVGRKTKPARKTAGATQALESDSMSAADRRSATINALAAAVAHGFATPQRGTPETSSTQQSRSVRMPFDTSPRHSSGSADDDLEPPRLFQTDPKQRSELSTPNSHSTAHSTNPLLGLGVEHPGLSEKIPPHRRPADLDLDGESHHDGRASTTSLADLIKRATRLAANLDRGKTASRLGMLDMFYSSDKRGAPSPTREKRESGISSMISAFPPPAATPSTPHPGSTWPGAPVAMERFPPRDPALADKPQRHRKCCGMSIGVFIFVITLIIVIIAAAVLVPLFLVVLPRQRAASEVTLSACAISHKCQNSGVSIVSGGSCGCVCVGGFTGAQCATSTGVECVQEDIHVGSTAINGATLGSSIPAIFSKSVAEFDIPLNSTSLLGLFSANNLTCTSENALVTFNNRQAKAKRFFILPHSDLDIETVNIVLVPDRPAAPAPTKAAQWAPPLIRRNGATTSDGIVFQVSSSTQGVGTSTAATAPIAATSSTSPPTPATTTTPSNPKAVAFAQTVVLYVFELSRTLSVAVNAQQTIQDYLLQGSAGGASGGSIQVGFGDLQLTADFGTYTVKFGNGTTVGGGF